MNEMQLENFQEFKIVTLKKYFPQKITVIILIIYRRNLKVTLKIIKGMVQLEN